MLIHQHFLQGSYPRFSASDFVTCEGFFILLHPEWLWYLDPEFGIHTISELLPVLFSGFEVVVVVDEDGLLLLGPELAPVA